MMKAHRKKRLTLIAVFGLLLGSALTIALWALRQNINLYFTPTQIKQGEAPHTRIRVGGLVKTGSVHHSQHGLTVTFDMTDLHETIGVRYQGLLPDLFREGQGIVAEGHLDDQNILIANEVLAKHDENYQPPPVKFALDGRT